MRRAGFRTETINCDNTQPVVETTHRETDFEKARGVSSIEVREGFSQVHISRLAEPPMPERLKVFKAIADAEISIDFLKMTPSGMSFLIPADRTPLAEETLKKTAVRFSIRQGRSIVLVHAVNIRDEEGLIASIVQSAIGCGTSIDHIGDMHDRMLLVVPTEDAARLGRHIEQTLGEVKA